MTLHLPEEVVPLDRPALDEVSAVRLIFQPSSHFRLGSGRVILLPAHIRRKPNQKEGFVFNTSRYNTTRKTYQKAISMPSMEVHVLCIHWLDYDHLSFEQRNNSRQEKGHDTTHGLPFFEHKRINQFTQQTAAVVRHHQAKPPATSITHRFVHKYHLHHCSRPLPKVHGTHPQSRPLPRTTVPRGKASDGSTAHTPWSSGGHISQPPHGSIGLVLPSRHNGKKSPKPATHCASFCARPQGPKNKKQKTPRACRKPRLSVLPTPRVTNPLQ